MKWLMIVSAATVISVGVSLPAFEVTAIRQPTFASPGQVPTHFDAHNLQLNLGTWSLQGLICSAYKIDPQQLVGPEWLAPTYFDIEAKLPEGAKTAEIPFMLRALLADRFNMASHTEKRVRTVRALIVGKGGLKISKKEPEGELASKGVIMHPANLNGRAGMHMEVSNFAKLAELLGIELGQPFVDKTGVEGNYDIKIEFPMELTSNQVVAPVAGVASEPNGLPELIAQVEKLGLKLETRKEEVDFLVVDHIERRPTEN